MTRYSAELSEVMATVEEDLAVKLNIRKVDPKIVTPLKQAIIVYMHFADMEEKNKG